MRTKAEAAYQRKMRELETDSTANTSPKRLRTTVSSGNDDGVAVHGEGLGFSSDESHDGSMQLLGGSVSHSEGPEYSSEPFNETTQPLSESVDFNGFLVRPSQAQSMKRILLRHPDILSEVQVKSKQLRTTYINTVLDLIDKMCQPLEELSVDDLNESSAELADAVYAGFKLDWLDEKLHQLLQKKKTLENADARLVELELSLAKAETEKVILEFKRSCLEINIENIKAEVATAKKPYSFDDIV